MRNLHISDSCIRDLLEFKDSEEYEKQGYTHIYHSPYRPLDLWCRVDGAVVCGRILQSKEVLPSEQVDRLELVPVLPADIGVYLLEEYRKENPKGAICMMNPERVEGCVISPSTQLEGEWQITRFGRHGFSGHTVEKTETLAIAEAYAMGYVKFAPGLLDRLLQCDSFEKQSP